VINSALQQLQEWRKQGLDFSVSVNIGAFHIQKKNFIQRLKELLGQYNQIDVSRLQIEVLETSTLDIAHVAQTMHECLKMGVDFALDDFGTGYSSLTYLKHLPANVVKIDRSFVRDMLEDPEDLAIVEGVIGLSKAFRREVVAEGVETMEHAEMLLMLGCDLAQGYAIAHPMPADDFLDWGRQWSPPSSWKNIQKVHNNDPQLLLAMVEHRYWVSNTQNFINGKQSQLPELDETKCRFGSWLKTDGKKQYQNHPEFTTIQSLHSEIHAVADRMLKNYQHQRYELAEEDFITFNQVHYHLLNDIKKLMIIAQSPPIN
jgi:EAL domain-containing protein (putative c-di-GMP-specific phosphodiesterase class I)